MSTSLLLVLLPIALIDSIAPFRFIPLMVFLGGKRPLISAVAFIGGISASYLVVGILALVGLDKSIDELNEAFVTWYNNPQTIDYVITLIVGLGLIIFARRMGHVVKKVDSSTPTKGLLPSKIFLMGVLLTIGGIFGMLPYFAAIGQILKANLGDVPMVLMLLYYNVIFILPLVALVIIRVVLRDRSERIFDAINRFLAKYGRRAIIIIMLILGLILLMDGIGWFMGYPLIPVDPIEATI